MARNLAQNESFWKGIAAGFFAGIGVAAALRYTPLEKFITGTTTVKSSPGLSPSPMEVSLNQRPAPAGFHSLRDHPESADDPRNLTSARTGAAAEFVRRGGAPGGKAEAEVLEVPGHPGERLDHIDLSQPQRKFRRSFDMGSAG